MGSAPGAVCARTGSSIMSANTSYRLHDVQVTSSPPAPPGRAVPSTNKALRRLLDNPYWIYGILRLVAPVFRIPFTRWHIVSRYDHVKEILENSQVFRVPWDRKVVELNGGGPAFVLGLDEPHAHREALQQLMLCFKREDVSRVAELASSEAEAILKDHIGTTKGSGRSVAPFDAIKDLVTRVPTRICRSYYGLPIAEDREDEFARWTLDISTYLFGDPGEDPALKEQARVAGDQFRTFLDEAIEQAKAARTDPTTILGRLVDLQRRQHSLTDDIIRAHLIGMVTGFVPTDTMAAGHMLNVLIGNGRFQKWHRKGFTEPVERAITDRDDKQLTKCLFETLRFLPINPGPFRVCHQTYDVKRGGWFGLGPRGIPEGARLIASTQSAMFDRRAVQRPYRFDPARSRAEYMLLGSGPHACVGIHLAEAQITHTLKPLLRQKRLRRAPGPSGQLARYGPFPANLLVQFDV